MKVNTTEFYTAKTDRVFKSICNEGNKIYLYKILEELLNKSITEITFMKSELDIGNTRSRTKMVDLVVKTKENEVIHVEVNSSISERTKFRNYCFFSNIISNDTRRGD